MNSCLKNENTQDQILNERIEAQKKFKIQSTPTIYINKKNMTVNINISNLKRK